MWGIKGKEWNIEENKRIHPSIKFNHFYDLRFLCTVDVKCCKIDVAHQNLLHVRGNCNKRISTKEGVIHHHKYNLEYE